MDGIKTHKTGLLKPNDMKTIKTTAILLLTIAGACCLHSCSSDKHVTDEATPSDTKMSGQDDDGSLPEPEKDPAAFYSAVSGRWRIEASDWLFYDSTDKKWKTGGTDPGYRGIVMGDADNEMLFGFGFWDESFGFMANVEEPGRFSIPIDPVANPVARVSSGASSYILFISLHDFETGYFYPVGNKITINLSDDGLSFPVNAVEGEATDENGNTVKTRYSYFALIGMNESTGRYTMFSNWNFPLTPVFEMLEQAPSTRTAAFARDSYTKLRSLWKHEAASCSPVNKVTEIIDSSEIDAVEYLWMF